MALLISFKNKISKFINLSAKERSGFIKYAISFPFFLLFYRIAGYKRTKRAVDYQIQPRILIKENKEDLIVKNLSKIINYSVANNILKSTCLEQSLFTYLILGYHGIICELKVGIDNTNDKFSAHAWVMYGDTILNDSYENIEKFKEIQML